MPNVDFQPDRDIPDLGNQVIIVTGGNVGLGLETIRQLAKHNPAQIFLAARSREKAEAVIQEIRRSDPKASPITFLPLDLASFDSVKSAVATFLKAESRLDILINNAGVMMLPEGLTKDGYEIQFGTNVMGHALLTQLLLPTLIHTAKLNPQTRVVALSSASEGVGADGVWDLKTLKTPMSEIHTTKRYGRSKLGNIHYASALARCYDGQLKVVSVHAGMVATNLHHSSDGTFLKPFLNIAVSLFATPVDKGARSQLWAAVSPDIAQGEFYAPVGQVAKSSKASRNQELSEKLWGWIQAELKDHLKDVE
jgi:NAD(P)-dependent dehydrogenase (short-subunit alcohol dehydrogenase family)